MSYYEEYTSCPQRAGVATATFDNHRHSREVLCDHCGYSEYRRPKYDEHGVPEPNSRVFETCPGFGALCFTSEQTKDITTIRQFKDERDIEGARRLIEERRNDFTWYRVTGWDSTQSKVVILEEHLAEGASVPREFRGLSIEELEEGPLD